VLSGGGSVVELTHWFLASVWIHLEANLVMLELTIEWPTTVIEQLSHLHFKLLAPTALKNLGFHLPHSITYLIRNQMGHE